MLGLSKTFKNLEKDTGRQDPAIVQSFQQFSLFASVAAFTAAFALVAHQTKSVIDDIKSKICKQYPVLTYLFYNDPQRIIIKYK